MCKLSQISPEVVGLVSSAAQCPKHVISQRHAHPLSQSRPGRAIVVKYVHWGRVLVESPIETMRQIQVYLVGVSCELQR